MVLLLDFLQILRLLLFAHIGFVDSQVVTSALLGQQHTWVTPSQLQERQTPRLTVCYHVFAVKWPLSTDMWFIYVSCPCVCSECSNNELRFTPVIPLFLIFIGLIIMEAEWRCGNVRWPLVSASETHLVGDVEAFVWVAECVSLFESLFPGHTSVHSDLQGTTKRPHQRWDN